jgi:hypothetical protein
MSRKNRDRSKRNKDRRAKLQGDSGLDIPRRMMETTNNTTSPIATGNARVKASDFYVTGPAVPATLFKYFSPTLQNIQNLKSNVLYFGSPKNFNDPYDCAIDAEIDELTDAEVEFINLHYLFRLDVPVQVQTQMVMVPQEINKVSLGRGARDVVSREQEKFMSERGVTCFSEVRDDILMWSHYGGSHRGFCLEFRTDLFAQSYWRKVTYSDAMPRIKMVPIVKGDASQIVDLFCLKAEPWSYEREWRCIHIKCGMPYTYPAQALKAIYFGSKMDRQLKEILCLILNGQNPDVELWGGWQSKSEFKIKFDRIPCYISHVDAKKRGIPDEQLFDRG